MIWTPPRGLSRDRAVQSRSCRGIFGLDAPQRREGRFVFDRHVTAQHCQKAVHVPFGVPLLQHLDTDVVTDADQQPPLATSENRRLVGSDTAIRRDLGTDEHLHDLEDRGRQSRLAVAARGLSDFRCIARVHDETACRNARILARTANFYQILVARARTTRKDACREPRKVGHALQLRKCAAAKQSPGPIPPPSP